VEAWVDRCPQDQEFHRPSSPGLLHTSVDYNLDLHPLVEVHSLGWSRRLYSLTSSSSFSLRLREAGQIVSEAAEEVTQIFATAVVGQGMMKTVVGEVMVLVLETWGTRH